MKWSNALLGAGLLSLHAQNGAVAPKFEVASVRPSKDCRDGGDDDIRATPGGLTMRCQTVMAPIQRAYVLFPSGHLSSNFRSVAVDGGPSWINTERYDINARTPQNASAGTIIGPMMQQLLEERFKFKVHRETRKIHVYLLTVAKDGPKLKRVEEGSCTSMEDAMLGPLALKPEAGKPFCGRLGVTGPPSRLKWEAYGVTLDQAFGLLHGYLGRVVIDKTGTAA